MKELLKKAFEAGHLRGVTEYHSENGESPDFENWYREHENEVLALHDVVGRSEQLCHCGKQEDRRYSPCCSLEHWHDKFS